MKLYLDRKSHFDYKHCLEMIKEQLDFLYKQNKISMMLATKYMVLLYYQFIWIDKKI